MQIANSMFLSHVCSVATLQHAYVSSLQLEQHPFWPCPFNLQHAHDELYRDLQQ